MQIPTGKLPVILSEIDTVLNACTQANAGPATSSDSESGLGAMLQDMQQLADVLTRIESDAQSSSDIDSEDSTGIGEYALQLLESLSTATEYPTLTGQQ